MLKNNYFFILVLLLTSIVTGCEKDEESPEQSGGAQVSGGEMSGGEVSGGEQACLQSAYVEQDVGGLIYRRVYAF